MDLVEEEMVADNALAVLSDEKAMRELAKDNKTLLQKIGAFFRNLANKLKAIKEKLSKSSIVYSEVNHNIDFLEQSAEKIRTMLDSVKENTSKQSDTVKYSKNTDFPNQVDEWYKNGHNNTETFIIGDTGEVLQGLGAVDNQIYFYGSKINSILKKHSDTMSLDIIKKVPEIIDNPALVLSSHSRSQENNTRLLMFGMVKDINGKPVMVVLDLQPMEKGLLISDMQKLTSAYSLTGEKIAINDYLNKSDVLYVTENKKIATKLVRQIGFHQNDVPIAFQQSGYIGNISYSGRSVNIQGVPFSGIFKSDDNVNKKFSKKTGYIKNFSQCDRVVESLDKYLSKKYDDTFELNGTKVEFISIQQSYGMGSYATFYIDFAIDETESITIRYSGHENSTADYYLWNDDFSSMKEIKKAIDDIVEQEVKIEMPERKRLQEELMAKLNKKGIKFSLNTSVDSEGNELTNEQQEYFKDSKVRDEDGNLLVVYHGSYEDFTVFDKTKGRANMDIQGMFFSPLELDAEDYGPNVKAYYLNITNPADEQTGYKALRKFQGQNEAGIKAREYLESLGYDGVNNGNEEYIAFNSNQIKLIDNAAPTDKSDIRYSKDTNFTKALTGDEKKKYNNAIMTGNDNGLRISDNSILVECENKSEYQYKYVVYDEFEDGQRITDVYAIGKIDTNVEDNVPSQYHNIAKYINDLKELGYDNRKVYESLLRARIKGTSYLLAEYNNRTNRYNVIGRGSVKNGTNTFDKSVGRGSSREDTGRVSSDRGRFSKYSRNTRLNYDENFDDVNEAFEQALNVLQNIKGIDVSSKVVEEIGKAQRNIDKELDGYHAQKMRNSNSVNKVARNLKEEYASSMPTGKLTNMLVDLYDYMANGDSTDMAYINSQAKVIANELINSSTSIVESDYKDIRKRITDKSYSLTPEVKKTVPVSKNTSTRFEPFMQGYFVSLRSTSYPCINT